MAPLGWQGPLPPSSPSEDNDKFDHVSSCLTTSAGTLDDAMLSPDREAAGAADAGRRQAPFRSPAAGSISLGFKVCSRKYHQFLEFRFCPKLEGHPSHCFRLSLNPPAEPIAVEENRIHLPQGDSPRYSAQYKVLQSSFIELRLRRD
eukprot:2006696-Pleurochrysis_carterae.AAC.5